GLGVTVLMTVDIVQSFTEISLSPHITEFLSDVLVLQRYVELDGRLEKVLAVVKMRTSEHDTSIHCYAIGTSGVKVGEPVTGHGGVLTGLPIVRLGEDGPPLGLTRDEAALLQALREVGEVDASTLAQRTGLKGSALALALERLRHLAYVSTRRRQGVPLYRAKAQTK
ncbi:MAG TPA: ATPase domain-containing protein, partial [Polyangiaceae bacterium]|nr:ATPase domain-containing protein [Polyangiaceae bacterium]